MVQGKIKSGSVKQQKKNCQAKKNGNIFYNNLIHI